MPQPWRPSYLMSAQLEERRRAAAARFPRVQQGQLSQRAPARLVGVSQWRLVRTHVRRGALTAGYPTEHWTLKRIAHLIQRLFGVRYHYRYLERPLKTHGLTPQRPAVQATERDDALVRAWMRRDWPALKKRLAAMGGPLPSWTKRVTRFGPA